MTIQQNNNNRYHSWSFPQDYRTGNKIFSCRAAFKSSKHLVNALTVMPLLETGIFCVIGLYYNIYDSELGKTVNVFSYTASCIASSHCASSLLWRNLPGQFEFYFSVSCNQCMQCLPPQSDSVQQWWVIKDNGDTVLFCRPLGLL